MTEYFIAVDGDDVGPKLRELIIQNELTAISRLSRALSNYFAQLQCHLTDEGYDSIFCGGDSLLCYGQNQPDIRIFENLPIGPCTISVGIAPSAEYAYLALQLAKARGKNQVVILHRTSAATLFRWKTNQ